MGLISNFLAKRKVSKVVADANNISKMTCDYINSVGVIADSVLRKNVTLVDTGNKTLLNYLGYIAGVIYCSCKCLNVDKEKSAMAPEIVFQSVIEIQLSWANGINEFSYVNTAAIAHGGSLIDTLQENPIFVEAMKLGWEDFSNRGQVGAFPKGLFELGLIPMPAPSNS